MDQILEFLNSSIPQFLNPSIPQSLNLPLIIASYSPEFHPMPGAGSELLTAGMVVCPQIVQIGLIGVLSCGF